MPPIDTSDSSPEVREDDLCFQAGGETSNANEYTVRLDARSGAKLGIEIASQGSQSLIVGWMIRGLMEEWNASNPNEIPVGFGSIINEVNGIRDSAVAMVLEMQKRQQLIIKVQMPCPEDLQKPLAMEEFLTRRLTMTERMRYVEARERWRALEESACAIRTVSTTRSEHAEETWEAASWWSFRQLATEGEHFYLDGYGYQVKDLSTWRVSPQENGPRIQLVLDVHHRHAGHTWYLLECTLEPAPGYAPGRVSRAEWPAPRRLLQLRLDLHDRVKQSLGEDYRRVFGAAPFAKLGGLPGTTARLKAWLAALSDGMNNGALKPSLVALTLGFLQAPLPQDFFGEPTEAGVRMESAGELDSQWGGDSAAGSSCVSETAGGTTAASLGHQFSGTGSLVSGEFVTLGPVAEEQVEAGPVFMCPSAGRPTFMGDFAWAKPPYDETSVIADERPELESNMAAFSPRVV